MTLPNVSGLPENLDASYADDPANPGRKIHQQNHDLLHTAVKALVDVVPGKVDQAELDDAIEAEQTRADATYAATIGLSNGTNDTATIQALLTAARVAGGGLVQGMPGQTYLLSAPLVPGTGTTLDMTGCTIKLRPDAINMGMIRNYSLTNATTVMDGAITAGTATLTSAAAPFAGALAVVGTPVLVWGAGDKGANLSTTIAAVGSAGSVTLATNALTTVSSAPVCVGLRDSNITLIGGTWDRNGATYGDASGGDLLRFRRADDIQIIRPKFTGTVAFHNINPGDCTNVLIESPHAMQGTETDIVHLNGPLDSIVIRNVSGHVNSCMVAITPNDYSGSNDVYGSVTNVDVDGIYPSPKNTGLRLAILGGSPTTSAEHIHVRNIGGRNARGYVLIGDDALSANTTGGLVDDIVLENISVQGFPTATDIAPVKLWGTNIKRVRVDGIHVDAVGAWTGGAGLCVVGTVTNAATVESLVVQNVTLGTFSGAGPNVIGVYGASVLSNAVVSGVRGSTVQNGLYLTNTATVRRAAISDVSTTGRFCPVNAESGTTLTQVQLANINANGGTALGGYAGTTELHVTNLRQGADSGALLTFATAAAAVTLYAQNVAVAVSTLSGTAGGTVRCKTFGCLVDVSSAFVSKNSGDLAYNTNSAAAGGIGPVSSDGIGWLPVSRSPATTPVKRGGYLWSAVGATISTASLVNNTMRYSPIYFDRPCTITEVGTEVTTAGAVGSVVRMGLYASDGAGSPTSTPLADWGTVTAASTGSKTITSLSTAVVTPGWYFLAIAGQGAPATPPTIRAAAGSIIHPGVAPLSHVANSSFGLLDAQSVTGALPSASPNAQSAAPIISVKFAA